ncbi:MAG: hypothetical protein ACU841_05170 [Gammaproteobacteria bacterium]
MALRVPPWNVLHRNEIIALLAVLKPEHGNILYCRSFCVTYDFAIWFNPTPALMAPMQVEIKFTHYLEHPWSVR